MIEEPGKTLQDLVRHLGRYPEDAFLFVREGLSFAVDQIHGPETEAHRALYNFINKSGMDWDDLSADYHDGKLPEPVMEAIDAAGGCEKLNRHVSGRDLCWAFRDYSLQRWGLMARVVLNRWNIHNTADFGKIVFGFIDFDMMRKQDDDTVEDFNDVYCFEETFDRPFPDNLSSDEEADASP